MKALITPVALALAACAGAPRYESRPVPFSNPPMPFEQAQAICAPRANAAANAARAQSKAELAAQKNSGGVIGGYASAVAPQNAYNEAGNGAYSGCLAENGWRLEKSCVQNCR